MNLRQWLHPTLCGLGLAGIASLGRAEPSTGAPEGAIAWSETVDGIRGRLVITDDDLLGKPTSVRTDGDKTFCVYIELQNVGFRNRKVALYSPYCFQNTEFIFDLVDSAGTKMARAHDFVGYDAFPGAIWLVLPVGSTLRFPVTTGGFEADPQGGPLGVRLQMDRRWLLSPGATRDYSLRCLFRPADGVKFINAPTAPANANEVWNGTLELPGVALPVRTR